MKKQSLYFEEPYKVVIREEAISEPGPGQLLVQTLISGISAGTERLIYQGRIPSDLVIDETFASLGNEHFAYPLKYGYATVGRVIAVGRNLTDSWHNSLVFAFNPHESHFIREPETLIPIDLSPDDAIFLPNMETAVSFMMDSEPLIGEQVAVFGQGIVGLLATMLLAEFPLSTLITLDPFPIRRARSLQLGATASVDPGLADSSEQVLSLFKENQSCHLADLTFELSGNPAALQQALHVTGFNGRILLGSWYGEKTVELDLGGTFHRSQIKIISSQVSHLAPRWRGRWDKNRRLQIALSLLKKHKPASLITHRFPLSQAGDAYRLLDQNNNETLQIVLTY